MIKIFLLIITISFLPILASGETVDEEEINLSYTSDSEKFTALKENESIPIIALRSEIASVKKQYNLKDHEIKYYKVDGATSYQLDIPQGKIILIVLENKVHQIIYQTGVKDKNKQIRKLRYLFKAFQNNFDWIFYIDNQFGKFYESSDDSTQGTWNYGADIIMFQTFEYWSIPKSAK